MAVESSLILMMDIVLIFGCVLRPLKQSATVLFSSYEPQCKLFFVVPRSLPQPNISVRILCIPVLWLNQLPSQSGICGSLHAHEYTTRALQCSLSPLAQKHNSASIVVLLKFLEFTATCWTNILPYVNWYTEYASFLLGSDSKFSWRRFYCSSLSFVSQTQLLWSIIVLFKPKA